MTGLGDRLKQARTAKGFTLDDLQSITKIQKRYLASIENEEYSNMPGSFYIRAFVKQYAEAVGLDADEMLSLYKESPEVVMPEEEERQLTSPTLSRRSGVKGSSELTKIMPKIIVALFIVVIIVVLWYLGIKSPSNKAEIDVDTEKQITVQDQQKPDKGIDADVGGKDKGEDKPVSEPEPEPEPEPEKAEQVLENVSVNGQDATYSLEEADSFLLEIKTTDESWIGVLDSARVERLPAPGARLMVAEESVELDVSDTDSVRIRVGRTASTEIYVNGELLEYANDRTTQNIIIEYKKEQ